MHFYPYPFYRPEFIWSLFAGSAEVDYGLAYFLMALVLVVGVMLFVGIGRLMMLINDTMVKRMFWQPPYKREPREAPSCGGGEGEI